MPRIFLLLSRENILYFLNLVYKVRHATQTIRREIRARRRATCPELAEATGLSLVTVHKEVRYLCSRGELRAAAQATSRGGRPAPVYECEPAYAVRALLHLAREGGLTRVQLELEDLLGAPLGTTRSAYASPEAESLDGMLDAALSHRRVESISLLFTPARAWEELRAHLQQRYLCPVHTLSAAAALADPHEGAATLYLGRGEPPQCCLRRHGRLQSAGRLDLLPLPAAWETLDYADHTLVEEMVARLLHIITCTLAPSSIVLHADFWSTRLTERIRFNTSSKLRGSAPPLHFRPCSAEAALAAMLALNSGTKA